MIYRSELYMHDLDRTALYALNRFPKFVQFKRAYMADLSPVK